MERPLERASEYPLLRADAERKLSIILEQFDLKLDGYGAEMGLSEAIELFLKTEVPASSSWRPGRWGALRAAIRPYIRYDVHQPKVSARTAKLVEALTDFGFVMRPGFYPLSVLLYTNLLHERKNSGQLLPFSYLTEDGSERELTVTVWGRLDDGPWLGQTAEGQWASISSSFKPCYHWALTFSEERPKSWLEGAWG